MKFSETQIKRSILKNIPKTTHSNLIKAGIGCDYARLLLNDTDRQTQEMAVAEGICVAKEDADIEYALIKLYNNLRVGCYMPFAITNSILMPSDDEKHMKKLLIMLCKVAKEYGMDVIAGHTEISEAVNKPIITMTVIGSKACSLRPFDHLLIKPGMDIVMTGQTGVMGTVKLLNANHEGLRTRYSETYLGGAQRLVSQMALTRESDIAMECGAVYSHDISTGGVYAALWELADAADVGIDICHDSIPILQETIEICEYTDHNPYMIDGSGAALFVCADGAKLSDSLYCAGYEAAVIGTVISGKDRTITHEDERRFLNTPRYGEI